MPVGEASAADIQTCLDVDRLSWRYVVELAREHRDWRSRRAVLEHLRALGVDATVTFPSYPDPRIGDLADVSNQHDPRHLTIAGRYARQERVDQLARLGELVDGPITRERPSEVQLATLPSAQRYELLHCRARSWVLLRDCLAINFFTDDKAELGRRKEYAGQLESRLATMMERAVQTRRATVPGDLGPQRPARRRSTR